MNPKKTFIVECVEYTPKKPGVLHTPYLAIYQPKECKEACAGLIKHYCLVVCF